MALRAAPSWFVPVPVLSSPLDPNIHFSQYFYLPMPKIELIQHRPALKPRCSFHMRSDRLILARLGCRSYLVVPAAILGKEEREGE
jgi:hypothetical protein